VIDVHRTCLLAALALLSPQDAPEDATEWKFAYAAVSGDAYRKIFATFEAPGDTKAFEGGAPVAAVVRDAKTWVTFWESRRPRGDAPVPNVDFATTTVLYVRSGAGADCATFSIGKIRRVGDTIEAEVVPRRTCPVGAIHVVGHTSFVARAVPVGGARSIVFQLGESKVEIPAIEAPHGDAREWTFEYVGLSGADYRKAISAFEAAGDAKALDGGGAVAGVVRDGKTWERLWTSRHLAGDVPLPRVDFATSVVLYVRSDEGADCATFSIGTLARSGSALEAQVAVRRCPKGAIHKAAHSGFVARAVAVGDASAIAFVLGDRRVEIALGR